MPKTEPVVKEIIISLIKYVFRYLSVVSLEVLYILKGISAVYLYKVAVGCGKHMTAICKCTLSTPANDKFLKDTNVVIEDIH